MVNYKELIEGYLLNNFTEKDKLEQIWDHLREENEDKLIDRKNFIGHFTASAFVIAKKSGKILMLHHKVLRKYLQPGGHIEKVDINPLEAAKRELFEETGIDSELLFYKCVEHLNELVPFNISIHKIPENKSKNEKSHYHYDLQYLFFVEDEIQVTINELESSSFEWIEWENFQNMIGYKNIAKKIDLLQSSGFRAQESFLSKIVSKATFEDVSCIAVQHIIPSSIPLIKTLKKIFGDRLLICAKPNSINQEVWNELKGFGIRMKVASRDDEFDLNYINGEYRINNEGDYLTEYKNEDNYFYVLNQGIPANFAVSSALGNYILLVHAAILFILQKNVKSERCDNLHSIYSLSETDNQYIAQLWLEHFNK
ncbi:NUDIX hydrolase [Streptococcus cuniculi]|uniref:NUDIX domain-containing protein n=1 Tax=Streptococcus cuniculi TaxID=1432788 RepID=A0A4Y9J8R4_9STRE|nr:NUDIX hydrolase [Streptococcus cuniculi]MBF0778639.1 NUDIX hydrolase [Streptococcus cuniculi]TFU97420.1 NUDIX domain-containing protein [Streptococcus cuniculi]